MDGDEEFVRIENPRVAGSIPAPATIIKEAHRDVGFFNT
jgi:hypothetical protein